MKKHFCYFHKDQIITYFCVQKNCTTPLCQKCLQIHFKHYNHQQRSSSIISINEAYIKAIYGLQSIISQKHKLFSQLQTQKISLYQQIDSFYQQIKSLLSNKQPQLNYIKNSLVAIKKGSLKPIIMYFSVVSQQQLSKYIIPQFPQYFKDFLLQCKSKMQAYKNKLKPELVQQFTFIQNDVLPNYRYKHNKQQLDLRGFKQLKNQLKNPLQKSKVLNQISSLAFKFKDGCESIQFSAKHKKIKFQDLQNPEKPKHKIRALSQDNLAEKPNNALQKCQTKRQFKQNDDILSPQQIRNMIKKKYSNRMLIPNKNVTIRTPSPQIQSNQYIVHNGYMRYLSKVNAESKYIIN